VVAQGRGVLDSIYNFTCRDEMRWWRKIPLRIIAGLDRPTPSIEFVRVSAWRGSIYSLATSHPNTVDIINTATRCWLSQSRTESWTRYPWINHADTKLSESWSTTATVDNTLHEMSRDRKKETVGETTCYTVHGRMLIWSDQAWVYKYLRFSTHLCKPHWFEFGKM